MLSKIIAIIIFCITITPSINANINVKDDLIPRKALFTLFQYDALSFSPNGKYISYITQKDNKSYIYVVDSENPDNIMTSISIKSNQPNYAWSYDNQHIFYSERGINDNGTVAR